MIFTDTYIGKFQPVQQSLYFLSLLLIYSTGTVHYKSLMNLTVHAIPTEDIKGNVHSPATFIHTHSTFSVNKTHQLTAHYYAHHMRFYILHGHEGN